MNTKLTEKINNFFNREFLTGAANIAIFKNDDGSYDLFNKFIISEENGKYKVKKKTSYQTAYFSSLKYAVTYCIYEEKNKILCSQRIEELDRLIFSVDAEIKLHKHLIDKATDIDNKLIYYAKLSDEVLKRNILLKEMVNYVEVSKHWQSQTFSKKTNFAFDR